MFFYGALTFVLIRGIITSVREIPVRAKSNGDFNAMTNKVERLIHTPVQEDMDARISAKMAADEAARREKARKSIERRDKVENAKAATIGFAGGLLTKGGTTFGRIKDNVTGRWEQFKLNRELKKEERRNDGRSNGRKAAIAGLIAVPLIGLGAYGANQGWFSGDNAPNVNDKATAASGSMNSDELRKNLTVETVDQNCVAIVKNNGGKTFNYNGSEYVKFDVASVEPVVADKESQVTRLWSDAISNPIENKDNKEKAQAEINRAICEDPEVGVMVANAFARMETDGVKLVDLNPWLAAYNVDPSAAQNQLNDKAAEFMPLTLNPGMDVQVALKKNQEYGQLSSKLVELLSRFSNEGRQTIDSQYNYELTDGGLSVGTFSEIGLNPDQYSADINMFEVTHKTDNGEECKMVFGFNVFDKRVVGGETGCEPAQPEATEAPVTPYVPVTPTTPETPYTPPTKTWTPKVDTHYTVPGPAGTTRDIQPAPTVPATPDNGSANPVGGVTQPAPVVSPQPTAPPTIVVPIETPPATGTEPVPQG